MDGFNLRTLLVALVISSSTSDVPIVFIPGNGASRLEVRRDAEHQATHCDPTASDWGKLWLDVWTFLPPYVSDSKIACWADLMELHYTYDDQGAPVGHNTSGVDIREPGWGETYSVELLDDSWMAKITGASIYAEPFVEYFVDKGYERGRSIRAAPYDFRLAPHSHGVFMSKLKQLIEETSELNDNNKVALVSHSYGGLMGIYFLNQQTESWKQQYIHGFYAASTPWVGTTMAHLLFASGYNYKIPGVDPLTIRQQQRAQETNVDLLAKPTDFWTDKDVFLKTPTSNYTAFNVEEFLNRVNYKVGVDVLKQLQKPEYNLVHPAVTFWCFHSSAVKTHETYIYNTENIDEQANPDTIVYGDGDGTVNLKSLQACQMIQDSKHVVNKWTKANLEHNDILGDQQFLDKLHSLLNN